MCNAGRSVSDPFEASSEQGPVAFQEQLVKVLSLIESGKREGATLLTGGDTIYVETMTHDFKLTL